MNVKKLVTASLFAALCCVMTLAIQIPTPMEGYVHLGDSMVLLSGFLLSPVYGALAAGIGSALADLFTGYTHYALATFIIKALMALVAHAVYRALATKTGKHLGALILAGIAAEGIMVVGYFAFAAVILGNGLAAFASVPMNLIQGLFGAAASAALMGVLARHKDVLKKL